MRVIAYKMVSENCKITLNKVCKHSEIEVLYRHVNVNFYVNGIKQIYSLEQNPEFLGWKHFFLQRVWMCVKNSFE